jgi:ribosomal protein S18 acetylase RimI-like enzyme
VQASITKDNYASVVKVVDGTLAGVVVIRVIADEVQVMMVATAEDRRRQGIASELFANIFEEYGCGYDLVILQAQA